MSGPTFATSRLRSLRRGVNVVELVIALGLIALIALIVLRIAR